MNNKNIAKFISLFILMAVLISTFSLPAFAEAESSDEVNNEELLWWEELVLFGLYLLVVIFSPVIMIVKATESIIQELSPMLAEFWSSILNFFARL